MDEYARVARAASTSCSNVETANSGKLFFIFITPTKYSIANYRAVLMSEDKFHIARQEFNWRSSKLLLAFIQ